MSQSDDLGEQLRRLFQSDGGGQLPPLSDEEIKSHTIQDPVAALGQQHLDDLPNPPRDESLPPGVKLQVADAVEKAIGEYDPEHPEESWVPQHERVPTTLPAEVWDVAKYEGVDLISHNQLTNLKPPNQYSVSYTHIQASPDVRFVYINLVCSLPADFNPRVRLLNNGGILLVSYSKDHDMFLLGRGGFGAVYKGMATCYTADVPEDTSLIDRAKHVKNREVVVKEVALQVEAEWRIYNERDVQPDNVQFKRYLNHSPYDFTVAMLVRHTHIYVLYDYAILEHNPTAAATQGMNVPAGERMLWVGFMEYVKGGDLEAFLYRWGDYKVLANEAVHGESEAEQQALLGSFYGQLERFAKWGAMPEVVTRGVMQQVYEAIAYLHELGVAHLDIKPANVMFDHHGTVKLVDFGLAHPVRSATKRETWALPWSGTPGFMAPEVMRIRIAIETKNEGLRSSIEATRADLYSLATMVFVCTYGMWPIPVLTKTIAAAQPGQQARTEIDFLRMTQLAQLESLPNKNPFWCRYVQTSGLTNPISSGLFAFFVNGMAYNPNVRHSARVALSGSGLEDGSWLAPRPGVDSLHDLRMKHGTIVPKQS